MNCKKKVEQLICDLQCVKCNNSLYSNFYGDENSSLSLLCVKYNILYKCLNCNIHYVSCPYCSEDVDNCDTTIEDLERVQYEKYINVNDKFFTNKKVYLMKFLGFNGDFTIDNNNNHLLYIRKNKEHDEEHIEYIIEEYIENRNIINSSIPLKKIIPDEQENCENSIICYLGDLEKFYINTYANLNELNDYKLKKIKTINLTGYEGDADFLFKCYNCNKIHSFRE